MKSSALFLAIFFVFIASVAFSEAKKDASLKNASPQQENWILERRPGFGVDLPVGQLEDVSLTDAFNYLMYCWSAYCTNYVSDWNCQYCDENSVVGAFTYVLYP
jgi:hypothetical protein